MPHGFCRPWNPRATLPGVERPLRQAGISIYDPPRAQAASSNESVTWKPKCDTALRERGTETSAPEHLQGAGSVPLYGRGCQRSETAVNGPKHFRFTKFQQSKLILRFKSSLCRAMRSHFAPPDSPVLCHTGGYDCPRVTTKQDPAGLCFCATGRPLPRRVSALPTQWANSPEPVVRNPQSAPDKNPGSWLLPGNEPAGGQAAQKHLGSSGIS